MRTRFNSRPPVVTEVDFGQALELPRENWKYGNYANVMNSVPAGIRDIIRQAPVQGNHENVLVDVKVQHLRPEAFSCIPGWHLDGPAQPLHPSLPEVHHLFIGGGAPTEFIDEEVALDCYETTHQKDLAKHIPEEVKVKAVSLGSFHTFTRFDWHRGVKPEIPLIRLLIRVTETNVILPSFTPKEIR